MRSRVSARQVALRSTLRRTYWGTARGVTLSIRKPNLTFGLTCHLSNLSVITLPQPSRHRTSKHRACARFLAIGTPSKTGKSDRCYHIAICVLYRIERKLCPVKPPCRVIRHRLWPFCRHSSSTCLFPAPSTLPRLSVSTHSIIHSFTSFRVTSDRLTRVLNFPQASSNNCLGLCNQARLRRRAPHQRSFRLLVGPAQKVFRQPQPLSSTNCRPQPLSVFSYVVILRFSLTASILLPSAPKHHRRIQVTLSVRRRLACVGPKRFLARLRLVTCAL